MRVRVSVEVRVRVGVRLRGSHRNAHGSKLITKWVRVRVRVREG